MEVNYLGVLAAAVVNMAVGFVWYGPLFGKMWKNLMGITDESMKNMKMKPMTSMVYGFITALVMAFVLDRFVLASGVVAWEEVCRLTVWIWLGFMAPIAASAYIWEGKPFKLFVLNALELLVALYLMGLTLVWLQ